MTVDASAADPAPGEAAGGRILGSAALLALGSIASRVLGLARESAIAALYGSNEMASALRIATSVPTLLNDLLINGQLSAAIVPVLTAYRTERREAFREAASVLLSAAVVLTGLASLLVYLAAGPIAALLAGRMAPEWVALVMTSLRIVAPAVMLLGLVGMLTGIAFSRERFGWPALAMVAFNAAFLVVVLLGYGRLGPYAMPVAFAASALAQLVVLLPAVRGTGIRLTGRLRHPALWRVAWLSLPIFAGMLIEQGKNVVDINLSSASYSDMQLATRLVQFPHGLVSVAISLAILPSLSASFARSAGGDYAGTLARGLRLVLALSLPAALGLMALAGPVVAAVYQRGAFGSDDTVLVSLALVLYLVGLPFASIDWPLNYAFYARQNTWLPALVGVVSVVAFLFVAITFGPVNNRAQLGGSLVFLGLVLADTVKHIVHATIMGVLVRRAAGPAALAGVGRTALGAIAAALVMAAAVAWLDGRLAGALPATIVGWVLRVALGVLLGAAIYLPLAARLGVAELPWIIGIVRRRLGRG